MLKCKNSNEKIIIMNMQNALEVHLSFILFTSSHHYHGNQCLRQGAA